MEIENKILESKIKKLNNNKETITEVKVSVIIPLYNVENYLKQCLDSVVNQTLKEIEIICINDGSTDNSKQILEDYARKDDRIKIINRKNSGQGVARNVGIKYAKGEYIGFVDSDDWVDRTMFEKLYENAKIHKSDIVMCPIQIVNENNVELDSLPYYNLDCFNQDFDNCVFDYTKTKDFILKIAVNAYNKIYRTEFITEISAEFPEGLIFEDNPFFYHTFLKAKISTLIRDYLYFHRVNRTDSTISKADKRFFDIIEIRNLVIKIFSSLNNFEDYEIDLLNAKIRGIIFRYFQVSDIYRQEFFELIKQDFLKMNLTYDKLNNLELNVKNDYLNIVKSNSNVEFELLKEKYKLLNNVNKLTNHKEKLLENNNATKIRQ